MIDVASLPFSLYRKSKALVWDPAEIDLERDRADWARMTERERDLIARLSLMFLGGEAAVTHDLAPMLIAVRRTGGRLEDEMFLTAQLFEESKHVEFFDRWRREIAPDTIPGAASGQAYARLFEVELPAALDRLLTDASDDAMARALCTYHLTIEGVLAETGYHGYMSALRANGLMPGTVRGVELVQRDEARHIAYGLHALGRLLSASPGLRDVVDDRLNELLAIVFEIVADTFAPYGDDIPFGMNPADFVTYAAEQLDLRLKVLERG